MDAATILVLVLTAGVIALLAWFEINSRRNDAQKESTSTLAQPDVEGLKKKNQSEIELNNQRKKTA